MKEIILAHLSEIERLENVKIIFACESGSRAWGFPSADSDFDVRFLYIRPTAWYLSIDEKRDVIERPIDEGLDISGWDLKKALRLLRKSNPPLLEWLGSPIIYLETGTTAVQMRQLAAMYYSRPAAMHHYLHMARNNFRAYLQGEEVWVKKYFYVLRPLLGVNWLERNLGVVPTEFSVLVNTLIDEPALRTAVEALLVAKRTGLELAKGLRIEAISQFIESELQRWETLEIPNEPPLEFTEKLDALFRASLVETNLSP